MPALSLSFESSDSTAVISQAIVIYRSECASGPAADGCGDYIALEPSAGEDVSLLSARGVKVGRLEEEKGKGGLCGVFM